LSNTKKGQQRKQKIDDLIFTGEAKPAGLDINGKLARIIDAG